MTLKSLYDLEILDFALGRPGVLHVAKLTDTLQRVLTIARVARVVDVDIITRHLKFLLGLNRTP